MQRGTLNAGIHPPALHFVQGIESAAQICKPLFFHDQHLRRGVMHTNLVFNPVPGIQ